MERNAKVCHDCHDSLAFRCSLPDPSSLDPCLSLFVLTTFVSGVATIATIGGVPWGRRHMLFRFGEKKKEKLQKSWQSWHTPKGLDRWDFGLPRFNRGKNRGKIVASGF